MDIEKLKIAAKNLIERDGYCLNEIEEFRDEATPEAVLELIAEVIKLRRTVAHRDKRIELQSGDNGRLILLNNLRSCANAKLKADNEDGLAVIRTQKQQLECYIKDAERYRWLEKNVKDKAMGISNEYATDWRRKYSFPLLLSQSAVSSPIALSEAIDAAMAQEQKS